MNIKPIFLGVLLLSVTVFGAESYPSFSDRSYPKNVYWGDIHVHTRQGNDAYAVFGTRLSKGQIFFLQKLDSMAGVFHKTFVKGFEGLIPRLRSFYRDRDCLFQIEFGA